MKVVLAFVGVAAVALGIWFLRGSSDGSVIDAKNAQIAALQDTIRMKDKLLVQNGQLVDARNEIIKILQGKAQSAEDLVARDQAEIDADKVTLQRIKDSDQNLITSVKSDNEADVRALKDDIQSKDDQIAQLNEKLVQTIADYEAKLNAARSRIASAPDDGKRIYPKDNGFEEQDLGEGMFAYQIFGAVNNPTNAPEPPPVPNRTPWTFGGSGNAGITANSAFYMLNATNGNHDGTMSRMGQAAYLQFKGSWFSQVLTLPAGTYSVGFDYEARRDYGPANGIAVSLDGNDLFLGCPTDTNNFAHITTETITLPAARKCELKFRGLGALADPTGDHTTFIDNVCINVVSAHKRSINAPGMKAAYQSNILDAPVKNAVVPTE